MVFLFYIFGIIGQFKGVVYIYGWVFVYLKIFVGVWFDIFEKDIVWVIVVSGW